MSSREKSPIEDDVIRSANLDVLRNKIGERGQRPLIPGIVRMKCPFRSNPAYRSQTRQRDKDESRDTPQRDPS